MAIWAAETAAKRFWEILKWQNSTNTSPMQGQYRANAGPNAATMQHQWSANAAPMQCKALQIITWVKQTHWLFSHEWPELSAVYFCIYFYWMLIKVTNSTNASVRWQSSINAAPIQGQSSSNVASMQRLNCANALPMQYWKWFLKMP